MTKENRNLIFNSPRKEFEFILDVLKKLEVRIDRLENHNFATPKVYDDKDYEDTLGLSDSIKVMTVKIDERLIEEDKVKDEKK